MAGHDNAGAINQPEAGSYIWGGGNLVIAGQRHFTDEGRFTVLVIRGDRQRLWTKCQVASSPKTDSRPAARA